MSAQDYFYGSVSVAKAHIHPSVNAGEEHVAFLVCRMPGFWYLLCGFCQFHAALHLSHINAIASPSVYPSGCTNSYNIKILQTCMRG